ncbi:hypothetical protein DMW15_22420 [Vibrio parahaemolyticus]|nr:hypothetical protein [Vibrio parahaemolyticus]EJG1091217.1 hypothetical protein [Vibrio parahaemolyticus]
MKSKLLILSVVCSTPAFAANLMTIITPPMSDIQKPLSAKSLMANYIQSLEHKFKQPANMYSEKWVRQAIQERQEYLLLCSSQLASEYCESAVREIKLLKETLEAHQAFQQDLAEFRQIHQSLSKPVRSSFSCGLDGACNDGH